MFESLAEAQIKLQLHNNVCLWLSRHPIHGAHVRQRIELAAAIISCSLYGAARHWVQTEQAMQRNGNQSPMAITDDALRMISATINALNEPSLGEFSRGRFSNRGG